LSNLSAEIVRAYRRHVRGQAFESSVVATATYFVTLVVVRLFTTFVGASPGSADIAIAGVHIHHLVFGVVALLFAGLFALDEVYRLPRAALFGIGAALVLDEFALLVFLKDVYWLPQGMVSIAALAIGLAALAVNAWRGRAFLRELSLAIRRRG
jgi:hypothetical protein